MKQLRKLKSELDRQYEAHLPMCRRLANMRNETTGAGALLSVDLSASQAVPVQLAAGSVPQYAAVYTSGGQQHYLSPLLLLSSVGAGDTMSSTAALQFVTVATTSDAGTDASAANDDDGPKLNLTNGNAEKATGLSNGDAAILDSNEKKHEAVNGVWKSAAVDTQPADGSTSDAQSCRDTSVVDGDQAVASATSVPASPVTESTHNTRQRQRKVPSSLRRSSEPPLRSVVKTSTAQRHMSSDQPPSKKAAVKNDSLPSFLSSMTDDD